MKSLRIFTMFVLIFAMTLSSSSVSLAANPGKNLAPNPSFEKSNKEKTLPMGWDHTGGMTFSWVKGIAYNGGHSICISNVPADRSGEWTTNVPILITPGATYTFSAYIKGDYDHEVMIHAWTLDADGNYNGGGMGSNPLSFNNLTWTYGEVSFTASMDSASVILALGINNLGAASTGTICYDAVALR